MENKKSVETHGRSSNIATVVGLVASLCGIILWVILNFFNPYSAAGITQETIIVTFIGLGLPAIIGLVGSVLRKEWLMYLVSVISLPLSAFLSGSPSIFKLFILVTMSYLVSAILFTRDKRNNRGTNLMTK